MTVYETIMQGLKEAVEYAEGNYPEAIVYHIVTEEK